MLNCLVGAVGVTNSDCQCILEGLTTDELAAVKVSSSGLYLDDLPGGVSMKMLRHADECRSFKKMADDAIRNAVKSVEDDLIVALSNKYKSSKKAFVGDIGRASYAANLGTSKRWQGTRLRPWDYSDGVITFSKFTITVNESQTFNVYLYRVPCGSTMGTLLATYPVTTTANMTFSNSLTTPLKLPLIFEGQAVEYWFVWDRTEAGGTVLPKDNKTECSTCERNSPVKAHDFLDISGVSFDDINGLSLAVSDGYAHGLVLTVAIRCDNETLFCREYNNESAVAVCMANAVRFKAGELLIEDVMKQPDINRYTMMENTYLWGKRNHFRAEYESRLLYLASVLNVDDSGCYVCRETANQPIKQTIFK